MIGGRAVLILGLGLSAVLGSCAPLSSAIYQTFAEQDAVAVPLAGDGNGASVELTLAPDKRARLVANLRVVTQSVQEQASGDEVIYHGRYRFPLTYRISASDGEIITKAEANIDWRDDSSDFSGRERESSLLEHDPEMSAAGGSLNVTAVFKAFDVPADGKVLATVQFGEDGKYQAHAEALSFEIEHDISDPTTRISLGIFMLVVGWITAIVGLVLVVVTNRPVASNAAPLAADDAVKVRQLAMFCHLAGLFGYIVPFGNVLGPLVMWLIYRERHPYIDEQGREALNFQLSLLVYMLLSLALILILLGLLMLPALAVFQLIMIVVAAVRVNDGDAWRYPLTFRFIGRSDPTATDAA